MTPRWPRVGTKVREPEGKHVGTLTAIISSQAIVRWDDNGWRQQFSSPTELEPVHPSNL